MQINIVLENRKDKSGSSLPQWIGRVFLTAEVVKEQQHGIVLNYLRDKLNQQFDRNQLNLIGGNDFQFLNRQIPVSRNQEKHLTSSDIALAPNMAVNAEPRHIPEKKKGGTMAFSVRQRVSVNAPETKSLMFDFLAQQGYGEDNEEKEEEEEEEEENGIKYLKRTESAPQPEYTTKSSYLPYIYNKNVWSSQPPTVFGSPFPMGSSLSALGFDQCDMTEITSKDLLLNKTKEKNGVAQTVMIRGGEDVKRAHEMVSGQIRKEIANATMTQRTTSDADSSGGESPATLALLKVKPPLQIIPTTTTDDKDKEKDKKKNENSNLKRPKVLSLSAYNEEEESSSSSNTGTKRDESLTKVMAKSESPVANREATFQFKVLPQASPLTEIDSDPNPHKVYIHSIEHPDTITPFVQQSVTGERVNLSVIGEDRPDAKHVITPVTETISADHECKERLLPMPMSKQQLAGHTLQTSVGKTSRTITLHAFKSAVPTTRPLLQTDVDNETSKSERHLKKKKKETYIKTNDKKKKKEKVNRKQKSNGDDTEWLRQHNHTQHSSQPLTNDELSTSHSQVPLREVKLGNDITGLASEDVSTSYLQATTEEQWSITFENKFIIVGPPPDLGTLESGIKHIEMPNAKELLKKLSHLKHTHKHPLWVDMSCDHKTFAEIMAHIHPKVHPLTVEDCISKDCREKLEIFDHYLFISIRSPSLYRERTQHISIIVFKTIILTYHEQSARVMDDTRKIIKRVQWYCPSPGWVCHAIVDGVIDALIPEVNRVVDEVQNLEQMVLFIGFDSQNEFLDRFQAARQWLAVARNRLWPKSALTSNLNNPELQKFLKEVPAPYWRDINDHISRMVDVVEIGLQKLESLQNVFVTKVSLEMSKQAVILSENASRLGATGVIFLPLVFIPTFYGMNIWLPFQNSLTDILPRDHVQWGFAFVTALMLLTVIITYHLVKSSGWIVPLSRKQF
ncbi:Magnesium transport protein corA [Reticulomyxa filosa]|uniref:Magnesium transport protein corA n=1 Tax=Reticulomyxa filosa TaxID=46433 RepID=X6MJR5_RETFI|nr:Magnesium transport protein corA [Reticulomyxa filosa]|eukprot:ETO13305.1 Magnesium transport protein corA [Reticulomyxa filosa]